MFIFSAVSVVPRNTTVLGIPHAATLGSYLTENMAIYDRVETLQRPRCKVPCARRHHEPGAQARAASADGDHYRRGWLIRTTTALRSMSGGPLNAEGTLRGRFIGGLRHHRLLRRLYAGGWNQTVYGAVDYDFTPGTTVGLGISNEGSFAPTSIIVAPLCRRQ